MFTHIFQANKLKREKEKNILQKHTSVFNSHTHTHKIDRKSCLLIFLILRPIETMKWNMKYWLIFFKSSLLIEPSLTANALFICGCIWVCKNFFCRRSPAKILYRANGVCQLFFNIRKIDINFSGYCCTSWIRLPQVSLMRTIKTGPIAFGLEWNSTPNSFKRRNSEAKWGTKKLVGFICIVFIYSIKK